MINLYFKSKLTKNYYVISFTINFELPEPLAFTVLAYVHFYGQSNHIQQVIHLLLGKISAMEKQEIEFNIDFVSVLDPGV